MKKFLCILMAAGFLVAGLAGLASAALIEYTFSGNYHDGSTTAGTFLFDTDADAFSDINIVLTGGSNFSDSVFTYNHYQGPHFIVLLDPTDGPAYNNDNVFHIILQDSGLFGELNPTSVYSDIASCDKDHCPARDNLDVATSTSLVGRFVNSSNPVPEPSAAMLFGLGMFCFIGEMKRR